MAVQTRRPMTVPEGKQPKDRGSELRKQRDVLAQRLETGYRMIADKRAEGFEVTAWEDFWLELLRRYERVCDELQGAMREEGT